MPTDKAGKFHLNTQQAMASDKMSAGGGAAIAKPSAPQAPMAPEPLGQEAPSGAIQLTPNGDGTYTCDINGETQVFGSLQEALAFIEQQESGGMDMGGDQDAVMQVAAPNLSGM